MASGRKPLEARIAVDVDDALEVLQMSRRPLSATIRAVEIDRRRRIGSAPGPVVSGINP
jgi:hypothetical protein